MNIERGLIVNMAEARIDLINTFNMAGKEGAQNWGRLVRLAQRAGFSEIDFRRLNASKKIVDLWAANAGSPPEEKRELFRRAIAGTLMERLHGRNPVIPSSSPLLAL